MLMFIYVDDVVNYDAGARTSNNFNNNNKTMETWKKKIKNETETETIIYL